jgi:hypothetical protein
LITVSLKEIVTPARKPVDHLRAAHFLRSPPRIQITVTVQCDAMLLDAHVAHFHFVHELVNGQSSGSLERVNDFKPLGTANFGD